MPIYEYICKDCGKEFEALQKFSEKPLRKCVHCSGKAERKISASAFHLKGSGWYKTDYASKSAPKESKKESDSPKPDCSSCPSC